MNQPSFDPNHFAMFLIPMIFFALLFTVIAVIPYWFIFKKAGFSPFLSILMFVPLANLIILYVVAFSEWRVVPAQQAVVTAYPPLPRNG